MYVRNGYKTLRRYPTVNTQYRYPITNRQRSYPNINSQYEHMVIPVLTHGANIPKITRMIDKPKQTHILDIPIPAWSRAIPKRAHGNVSWNLYSRSTVHGGLHTGHICCTLYSEVYHPSEYTDGNLITSGAEQSLNIPRVGYLCQVC